MGARAGTIGRQDGARGRLRRLLCHPWFPVLAPAFWRHGRHQVAWGEAETQIPARPPLPSQNRTKHEFFPDHEGGLPFRPIAPLRKRSTAVRHSPKGASHAIRRMAATRLEAGAKPPRAHCIRAKSTSKEKVTQELQEYIARCHLESVSGRLVAHEKTYCRHEKKGHFRNP